MNDFIRNFEFLNGRIKSARLFIDFVDRFSPVCLGLIQFVNVEEETYIYLY